MQCQRCGKELGEYQCSVCKKIIGRNCTVNTENTIFCLEHAPQTRPVQTTGKPRGSPTIRNMIIYLTIGLAALAAIFFLTTNYIAQLGVPNEILPIINTLRSVQIFILGGVGAIWFLMIIFYIITRSRVHT